MIRTCLVSIWIIALRRFNCLVRVLVVILIGIVRNVGRKQHGLNIAALKFCPTRLVGAQPERIGLILHDGQGLLQTEGTINDSFHIVFRSLAFGSRIQSSGPPRLAISLAFQWVKQRPVSPLVGSPQTLPLSSFSRLTLAVHCHLSIRMYAP